jgi:hypothetical protein
MSRNPWIKEKLTRFILRWSADFFARELCKGILAREPGPKDLAACAASIRQSGSIAPLAERLIRSNEFQRKSFAAYAPKLVTGIYKGLLGRDPDPEGLKINTSLIIEANDFVGFMVTVADCMEFRHKMEHKLRLLRPAAPPANANGAAARPRKGRLIVVSSNCQTAGVTAALQECLPADTVVPMPIPLFNDPESEKRFAAEISDADVWVVAAGWKHILSNNPAIKQKPGFRHIEVPCIGFPAFHPDLCEARKTSDKKRVAPHYNSAIGVWAYNNGLDIAGARKLFNRRSYAGLGYFNLWEPSIAALRNLFSACDLDFSRFMLAVKRSGAFMHSVNRPQVNVLVELARLISVKIGASNSVFDKSIHVSDSLTGEFWPVYPEVADELSLPSGSYDWKINNRWIEGLDGYLEFAFGEYEKQKIPRGGLELESRDQALFDRVLGPQAGVAK